MTDLLAAVYQRTIGNLEVGAGVWSKSLFADGGAPRGGVVIDLLDDAVAVMRIRHAEPFIEVFPHDDINLETIDFHAKDARAYAAYLHTWLGRPGNKKMDAQDRVGWGDIALALDKAGLTGTWLPRAEARYRAALEARRAAS